MLFIHISLIYNFCVGNIFLVALVVGRLVGQPVCKSFGWRFVSISTFFSAAVAVVFVVVAVAAATVVVADAVVVGTVAFAVSVVVAAAAVAIAVGSARFDLVDNSLSPQTLLLLLIWHPLDFPHCYF